MLEWRELFIPTILERGKKILHNNISDVHITEEGIRAKVKGTEEYDLLIRIGLNEMTCTCPFAMRNNLVCKHMAALLIFCENNWSEGMAEFFKDSENSPLGRLAIKYKVNRMEKERINAEKQALKAERERIANEKYQERMRNEQQRKIEQVEKARLAEERRKEKAILEEERRIRREERKKKLLESLKAEEEKFKKLEEERKIAEERRKRKREEWERLRPIREANEKREAERRVQEAEEQRQKKIDKVVARERHRFPKALKDELAEIDEQIKSLEDAERDLGGGEFDIMPDSERLKETGWYYSDDDLLEGDYFVDEDGKEYFVPEGFQPGFHK